MNTDALGVGAGAPDVAQGSRWREGWPAMLSYTVPGQLEGQSAWQAYDNAEGDPAPHAAVALAELPGSVTAVNPLAADPGRGWMLMPGDYGRVHGVGPVPAGRL